MVKESGSVLTVEIKNTRPVELLDLTASLQALAYSFREYANERGDPLPDNIQLYVSELRTGSIIAQLSALAEQAQWVLDHVEILAGFVSNTQDVVSFFLGRDTKSATTPSKQQAAHVSSIVEPIAKDGGSQINISINGPVTFAPTIVLNSLEANALQNSVKRYLGAQLPATMVKPDEVMTLEQVKNSAKSRTGDRGIIETISDRAVKLQFLSDESKRKVLELHENPFQCAFLVDVEVRSAGGKPVLYRILDVKDVILPD